MHIVSTDSYNFKLIHIPTSKWNLMKQNKQTFLNFKKKSHTRTPCWKNEPKYYTITLFSCHTLHSCKTEITSTTTFILLTRHSRQVLLLTTSLTIVFTSPYVLFSVSTKFWKAQILITKLTVVSFSDNIKITKFDCPNCSEI